MNNRVRRFLKDTSDATPISQFVFISPSLRSPKRLDPG